jgi:hypothetical protein
MGTSLELLRHEGLVEALGGAGMADNALLGITASGRAALQSLLQAHLRAPLGDHNRLSLLVKLRFMHHLPREWQEQQRALIAETLEGELARLEDLRRSHDAAPGPFRDWLDQDIALLRQRLALIRGAKAAKGVAAQ